MLDYFSLLSRLNIRLIVYHVAKASVAHWKTTESVEILKTTLSTQISGSGRQPLQNGMPRAIELQVRRAHTAR